MTGKEDIKIGDELMCMSNEGLYSLGDKKTIVGLTETSINFINCGTSWQSRESVRWHCYKHLPREEQPNEPI